MYSKGLGMEKDIIESYAYFNLAARTNPDSAKARDALERRMTIQQVSAAQKRAREIRELIDKNLHEHPATK
jgi:TPR repeat protein